MTSLRHVGQLLMRQYQSLRHTDLSLRSSVGIEIHEEIYEEIYELTLLTVVHS